MPDAWYKTKHWRIRRRQQLMTEPFCRMCREEGRAIVATVADHIEPHRENYKAFFFGELQSLCELHHSAAKQRQENRGYDSRVDHDGYPVDPNHPVNKQ
jgi:hypothetical protein